MNLPGPTGPTGPTGPVPGRRPQAYIASPLGFTPAGRHYYDEVLLPALARVVEPVDPWALTAEAEIATARAAGPAAMTELALEIGRRNLAAIRSAQLLVAVLDGQEVDSGTAAEVGYASALGRRCYGLREDLREAGEPGVAVNLQVVSCIAESGGAVLGSLEALLDALALAADPGPV